MIGKAIYKRDSKGKLREWKLEVTELPNGSAEMKTIAGLVDGKKVETVVIVSEGKNIGKVNETTPLEQAKSEAESTYTLKLRKGYFKNAEDAKQGVSGSGMPKPMLAQKYSREKKTGAKTLEQMKIIGKEVALQPKIDGNRCLIKVENGEAQMWTRTGKLFDVQIPHILVDACALIDEGILDGELFSDEMTFNELNGLIKRFKNSKEEDTEKLKTVKYHLYDYISSENYKARYNFLAKRGAEVFEVPSSIILIENHFVTLTQETLDEKFGEFIEEGHEGLMIRTLDKGYENKRSWQLVKVKEFEDEEFEVVDILEDKRGGFVGKFVMRLPEICYDRDGKPMETFEAGIANLTQEEGAEIFANKEDYIGLVGTVEFFGKSEYGIPRFPKFKGFRNDG